MKKLLRIFHFINHHPLAKQNLLHAYTKFVKWQILSSLQPSKFFLVPFADRVKIFAKKGLTGVTGNIYTGLHEFADMAFLLHFLRAEDVFFDIGANVGTYSILASGVRNCFTVSFEPVLATFKILEKNITVNKLEDRILAENKGAGSKNGVMYFTTDHDTTNHIVTGENENENITEVLVCKPDDYYPLYKPSLLKIDVEGFETEVLNGATELLQSDNLKAIIIELNGSGLRYGYDEGNIHNHLLSVGFKPYQYDAFSRKLTWQNSFGKLNTIYIRDIEFVQLRLEQAKKFKVFNKEI